MKDTHFCIRRVYPKSHLARSDLAIVPSLENCEKCFTVLLKSLILRFLQRLSPFVQQMSPFSRLIEFGETAFKIFALNLSGLQSDQENSAVHFQSQYLIC